MQREGVRNEAFARDVREGLGSRPKRLPPKYFYDALGSHLFDAICQLPWYRITRAELTLLEAHAREIVAPIAGPVTLVELGCGSGEKIGVLVEALRARDGAVDVRLVDISPTALALTERRLATVDGVRVRTHCATYEAGLGEAGAGRRGPLLVLFLGSNIGNFDGPEARAFLGSLRKQLEPGDGLLLGADLVKPEAELLVAYDDPVGVTAAFDKNVLLRINRELGGHFDLATFAHRAEWNAVHARVEMHLVSVRQQAIAIDALGARFEFAEGETIWTESSYKYTPRGLAALGEEVGLRCHAQWIEPEAKFCATLFVAA